MDIADLGTDLRSVPSAETDSPELSAEIAINRVSPRRNTLAPISLYVMSKDVPGAKIGRVPNTMP